MAVLDLFLGELDQVLVDDVADMLEVGGEGDDLHAAAAAGFAQHLLAAELHQVDLDRLVQLVDHVVALADLARELAVVGAEHGQRVAQHRFQRVAHAQGLARRGGKRELRAVHRRRIEIARLGRVVADLALRQEALDQRPRER